MFMAGSFCAYARKMTYLKISPLLNYSNEQLTQNFFNSIKSVAQMMNTKITIQDEFKNPHMNQNFVPKTVQEDELFTQQSNKNALTENDWQIYMPLISPFE
jgi:predicted ferric reductase